MATDTTARQNTVIWSATGTLVLLLLAIIGWFIIGKDNAVLTSINKLGEKQEQAQFKAQEADQKILENINKICDRLGVVENRVSNLEIFIQMPFIQRQKLFESFKLGTNKSGKE